MKFDCGSEMSVGSGIECSKGVLRIFVFGTRSTLSILHISLLFLSVHLIIGGLIPLFDDEAYYALWARDLALGYYDHPPMIAYLVRMGTELFGETTFGIRLFPVIAFIVSGYLVGNIVQHMCGSKKGPPELATTLYNLNLLVFALGSFATPDAPSTLFWVAALWATIRAIDTPRYTRSETCFWVCTGLFVGFGCLSKFTNAFLGIGLLAYLVATLKGRSYLATRLPYVSVVFAILPLLPYLFWNFQTDWLGLERQGSRLTAGDFTSQNFGQYAALLLLAPTPLVTWFALRALKRRSSDFAVLIWSSVPLLIYFAFHATHAPIQANWIVPSQSVFVIVATVGIARCRSSWLWGTLTVAVAFLMSVAFFATAFNPVTPIGSADNPPNQTRGWLPFQSTISELLEESGATWIATTDYARTGSLALRFPDLRVWSLTERQRYKFRGAFPAELCAAQGLLIERAERSESDSQTASRLFESAGSTQHSVRSQGGVTLMQYHLTPVARLKDFSLCQND